MRAYVLPSHAGRLFFGRASIGTCGRWGSPGGWEGAYQGHRYCVSSRKAERDSRAPKINERKNRYAAFWEIARPYKKMSGSRTRGESEAGTPTPHSNFSRCWRRAQPTRIGCIARAYNPLLLEAQRRVRTRDVKSNPIDETSPIAVARSWHRWVKN